MDFGLSEEQEMLQETVRGFVQNECPTTRLRELFDAGEGHDPALWSGLAEMGLAGLIVPEEHGGAAMELLDLALVAQVLGEAALPSPLLGHVLASLGVMLEGSAAQQAAILPALASGEQIAVLALQEGDVGWSPSDWTLKLDGDRLSGEKTIVTHAHVADRILVGLQGGGLAWVEADAQGVEIERVGGVDRSRPLATVRFEGAPAERLVGGEGEIGRLMDAASVLLAATPSERARSWSISTWPIHSRASNSANRSPSSRQSSIRSRDWRPISSRPGRSGGMRPMRWTIYPRRPRTPHLWRRPTSRIVP
jgi:alkylation response protein AidB-like acyl-CoA dehydrogenase